MTHEYVIAMGGRVLGAAPGDGPAPTAIGWAADAVLAVGPDDVVRAISRGDSTFLDLAGCTVTAASADVRLEPGAPADLDLWRAWPPGPGALPLARVRAGAFTEGDEHCGPFARVVPTRMRDDGIRALFAPEPGLAYLDAATYGLPPEPTVEATRRALDAWQTGSARWVDDWDRPTDAVRADFAALIGASAADIALIPAASVGMGLVANELGPDDVVVVPEDEHVSDLFPLLVAERRGATVRQVPFAALPASIAPGTTLVVSSLVQMQTGRVADLGAICRGARAVGARVFIDSTHATPYVPVADHIADVDYLVCHAYKHLLGARGSAFLYVRADHLDELTPTHANWRGAADPWGTFFGGPLTLADDAARFNVSLAWLPWVATRASLRLVADWAAAGVFAGPLALAAAFREALGVEPSGSSLVCVPVDDTDAARAALDTARVKAAVRGGGIRFSVHVWNDEADVERAVAAIRPFIASG